MVNIVRPPSKELQVVAEVIEQMIGQYLAALRSAAPIGRWEAPQEALVMSRLLIRNVEAVILMARSDEVLVTAAWSNARVAFELSARIIWMLHPRDRYAAECRWLAFLDERESAERKLADPTRDSNAAEVVRVFREGVITALPRGYQPTRIPRFRDMLTALDSPEMYRLYQEGSQYVHGGMYATASYSKNLGNAREFGDFTSTTDWVLPMRLCWLSLREAARFVLDRLDVQEDAIPNWKAINSRADSVFQALATLHGRVK